MDAVRDERARRRLEWQATMRRNGSQQRVLYKEWELKFKETVEEEPVRERKRILEQIKRFKKPISREEFEEHAKQYEDIREKHGEIRVKEREHQIEELEQNFDADKYRTKTYQEVALYDLHQKEERESREEMKRLLIEKKDSYAKYVREMHVPVKSRKKEEELEELVKRLKHPVKEGVKYAPGLRMDSMRRSKSMSRRGLHS